MPDPVNPNPDEPDASSDRIDPGMAGSARQSPYPDVEVYNRPATDRISAGNLGLSIGVIIIVGIVAAVLILWFWSRMRGEAAEAVWTGMTATLPAVSAFLLPARFR